MFHDIRNIENTNYPKRYNLKSFLNENQFLFQINEIRKRYKIISSLDIKNIDLETDDENYAVLTFDDGLLDHYKVFKHLKALKISGTFFIPRMPIVEKRVMNTHKIQFILAAAKEKIIVDEILSLFDNKDEIWSEYSVSRFKNNWWSKEMTFITNFLRSYKDDRVNYKDLTDLFFKKFVTEEETNFSNDLYLNVDQIEEMADNGMVIGGHGNISENLLLLEDYKSDIDESKKFISKYSDEFSFSYPNGGFNNEIKNYMRQANCVIAYTTIPTTLTELDNIDYLEFPRYDSPQIIKLP